MLTENEIRVLILHRVMAACDSCNGHFINHVEGQIRGLLAVLTDGKNIDMDDSIRHILDVAGIPWEDRADGGWNVPDEWCIANGCTVDDDEIEHPKLAEW